MRKYISINSLYILYFIKKALIFGNITKNINLTHPFYKTKK